MKFRKHFDYDVDEASAGAVVTHEYPPSLTVQSMAEDADINVIVARFGITGRMPENPRLPQYGDFSGISDYQSAMNAVLEAQEAFMELTPQVRARFDNDPQKLLEFVADDRNITEARSLGLLKEVPNVQSSGGVGAGVQPAQAAGAFAADGGAPGGGAAPDSGAAKGV